MVLNHISYIAGDSKHCAAVLDGKRFLHVVLKCLEQDTDHFRVIISGTKLTLSLSLRSYRLSVCVYYVFHIFRFHLCSLLHLIDEFQKFLKRSYLVVNRVVGSI